MFINRLIFKLIRFQKTMLKLGSIGFQVKFNIQDCKWLGSELILSNQIKGAQWGALFKSITETNIQLSPSGSCKHGFEIFRHTGPQSVVKTADISRRRCLPFFHANSMSLAISSCMIVGLWWCVQVGLMVWWADLMVCRALLDLPYPATWPQYNAGSCWPCFWPPHVMHTILNSNGPFGP